MMSKIYLKTFFLFFFGLQSNLIFAKNIVLFGQFHLSSKTMTTEIEKSKDLPQYLNQKTIFLILDEWIRLKKVDLIISEGCVGELNSEFKKTFNGWSYKSLRQLSNSQSYKKY